MYKSNIVDLFFPAIELSTMEIPELKNDPQAFEEMRENYREKMHDGTVITGSGLDVEEASAMAGITQRIRLHNAVVDEILDTAYRMATDGKVGFSQWMEDKRLPQPYYAEEELEYARHNYETDMIAIRLATAMDDMTKILKPTGVEEWKPRFVVASDPRIKRYVDLHKDLLAKFDYEIADTVHQRFAGKMVVAISNPPKDDKTLDLETFGSMLYRKWAPVPVLEKDRILQTRNYDPMKPDLKHQLFFLLLVHRPQMKMFRITGLPY